MDVTLGIKVSYTVQDKANVDIDKRRIVVLQFLCSFCIVFNRIIQTEQAMNLLRVCGAGSRNAVADECTAHLWDSVCSRRCVFLLPMRIAIWIAGCKHI